ncbi:DHH family phosphoesterase [Ferrimonas gelatinilytica]|uniref:Acetyltransferase n=1 Tax=Ferrimonas gelatinilytica TaxID=1255257 RepID=A0ABP9RTM8_9GAMM
MADFDLFNGDADGIFSLLQLRKSEPREATLVTGVKRDIALLERVTVRQGDRVTVLDISLDRNRDALKRVLNQGAWVHYIDHHFAGSVPRSPRLTTLLDPAPGTCTALLVDRYLDGAQREWAIAGAYGDNLLSEGDELANRCGLNAQRQAQLRQMGELVNYNAYGRTEADLHCAPAALFHELMQYASPWAAWEDQDSVIHRLKAGFEEDLRLGLAVPLERAGRGGLWLALPDAPWAHRIIGTLANRLARAHPEQALLLMIPTGDHHHQVSLRAPLNAPLGADRLCRRYPSGGGRASAAGINTLPNDQISDLLQDFSTHFPGL